MKFFMNWIGLPLVMVVLTALPGCYTVVDFSQPSNLALDETRADEDVDWIENELDGEIETDFLYDDGWAGDLDFDPYWHSPYWMYYGFADPWRVYPVAWYGWGAYGYGGWPYWGYWDAYDIYDGGYWDTRTLERRSFTRRGESSRLGADPRVVTSSGGGTLGKSTVSGSTVSRRRSVASITETGGSGTRGTSHVTGATSIGRARSAARQTGSSAVRPTTRRSTATTSSSRPTRSRDSGSTSPPSSRSGAVSSSSSSSSTSSTSRSSTRSSGSNNGSRRRR